MPTPKTYAKQILQLIMDNKLKEAISALQGLLKCSSTFTSLIMQSARYNEVMKSIKDGTINLEDAKVEKNRITYALIDMTRELETQLDSNAALQQEVEAHLDSGGATHIHNEMHVTGNHNISIQGVEGSNISIGSPSKKEEDEA